MRSAEWLDSRIAYCEAAIRHMTDYPADDAGQAAQDAEDLASARRWLAELRAERAEVQNGPAR